jgi:tRNA A37 methylthiotransferase MiaB
VPSEIIEQRVHRLLAHGEKSLAAYAGRWLKKPVRILVEENNDNGFEGLTPEFIRVRASGKAEVNQIVIVRPSEMVSGELMAPAFPDEKTS